MKNRSKRFLSALVSALCFASVSTTVFADADTAAVTCLDSAAEQTSADENSESEPAETAALGSEEPAVTEADDNSQETVTPAAPMKAEQSASQVISVGMTTAAVKLTTVEGAVYYEIWSYSQQRVLKTVDASEAEGEVLLEGLIPQFSQQLKVTAFFADGTSRVTEKLNIATRSIPKVTVTVSSRSHSMTEKCTAKIKWTKSTGVDGYILYNAQTNEEIAHVYGENNTTYTFPGLRPGTDLRVYARSFVNVNGKEYMSVTSNRTWIHCYPQGISMNITSYNTDSIRFSLTHSCGADGYYIYLSTNGGSYSRVLTLEGDNNLSGVIGGLSPKTNYSLKAVAYHKFSNNNYLSSYSSVKTVTTAEYKKTTAQAKIYAQPGYSENYLGTVPKGKNVLYFGETGRWVKIRVGGVNGYIYNKALGVVSNGTVNSDMEAYVDDLLFDNGTTPGDICTWVSENCYYIDKTLSGKTRDRLAYEMLVLRSGSCYYFAGLCDYMLERAGYEHRFVKGQSGFGEHCFNEYVTSEGTLYLDTTPFRAYDGIFYDWTWEQVKANRPGYTKD